VEVMEHTSDRAWLAKMTNTVSQHWKQKNLRKTGLAQVEPMSAMDCPSPRLA